MIESRRDAESAEGKSIHRPSLRPLRLCARLSRSRSARGAIERRQDLLGKVGDVPSEQDIAGRAGILAGVEDELHAFPFAHPLCRGLYVFQQAATHAFGLGLEFRLALLPGLLVADFECAKVGQLLLEGLLVRFALRGAGTQVLLALTHDIAISDARSLGPLLIGPAARETPALAATATHLTA